MEYGMEPLSNQDLALLSAYLDGQLTEAERQQLEKRLAEDTILQAELAGLQEVVHLLNSLPRLQAPRNFTLDPAIYGKAQASQTPSTKITRLNIWQLSSLAGVAASILLVMAGLLIGNPFDASNEDESSAPNNVAQITQSKTDTHEADADTTMFREDETAIAILPSESVESQEDLGLTITAEVARAYASETPTLSFDEGESQNPAVMDDAGYDPELFNTDEMPPAGGGMGSAGDGSDYPPSPINTFEPQGTFDPSAMVPPPVSAQIPSPTEAEDYDDTGNDTQSNEDDTVEESAEGATSLSGPTEGNDVDGEDSAAEAMPADESQQEKFWETPFSDEFFTVGIIGLIVSLFSLLLNFLLH